MANPPTGTVTCACGAQYNPANPTEAAIHGPHDDIQIEQA